MSSHTGGIKRKRDDSYAHPNKKKTVSPSGLPTTPLSTGNRPPVQLPWQPTPSQSFSVPLFTGGTNSGQSNTSHQPRKPTTYSPPIFPTPQSFFGQSTTSHQQTTPFSFNTPSFPPPQSSFGQLKTSHQPTTLPIFSFPSIHTPNTHTPSSQQPSFLAPLSLQPSTQQAQHLPSISTPSKPTPSLSFPTLGTTQPVPSTPNQTQNGSQSTTQTTPQTTQSGLLPSVPVTPSIRFRIGENGKIHYFKREDTTTQQTHAGSYLELGAPDFTVFKNAGKRYGSSKITDPDSLQSYVLHQGQFYEFDKSASNKRGKLATDQSGLLSKHQGGQLVDRSRTDRIGGDLQPFDVGHYKQVATGSKFDVLSKKRETFGANRDHVVSGESLKRRAKLANQNAGQAYNQGLTIAIPNDEMHKPHSPTFGGRQSSKDTVDGVQKERVEHDAQQPALAFYRDTTTILQRTANQNHGTVDPKLDLTQPENRIRQIGAYRTLFKASTSMFAKNANRGFDPTATAFDLTHTPKPKEPNKIGNFSAVTSTSGQSQGTRLAQSLAQNLKDTGKAK